MVDLLTADTFSLVEGIAESFFPQSQALFPQWGVYLDGIPVILPISLLGPTVGQTVNAIVGPIEQAAALFGVDVPNLIPVSASTAKFEAKQDWVVADYPIENGSFQSYDKVQLPIDLKVTFVAGGIPSARQTFLNTISAMCNSLSLFDVVTPELVYTSYNASHFDYRKTADSGVEMLVVDVWFVQIRLTDVTQIGDSTAVPGIAAPQGIGSVKAATASTTLQTQVNNGGGTD